MFHLARITGQQKLQLMCIEMIALRWCAALAWIDGRELMRAREMTQGVWNLPPVWRRATATVLATTETWRAVWQTPEDSGRPSSAAEVEAKLAALLGKRAAHGLLAAKGNTMAPEGKGFLRTQHRRQLARHPLGMLLNFPGRFRRFIPRMLKPPGTFIALMGPDGVGKTSTLDAIEKQLENAFPIAIRHAWRPGWLPSLHRLKTGEEPETPLGEKTTMAGVKQRSAFMPSLVRLIYYGIDYAVGYWLRVRPELNRGCLVISDRYFYDYFVDPGSKGVTMPGWLLRAFCTLYPRPRHGFILMADPIIVRARKADLSVAEIERQNETFRALAQRYPELELIDSTQELDVTADRIVRRMFGIAPVRPGPDRANNTKGGD